MSAIKLFHRFPHCKVWLVDFWANILKVGGSPGWTSWNIKGVKMNLLSVKYEYLPSALHYGDILFSDTLVNIGPNLFLVLSILVSPSENLTIISASCLLPLLLPSFNSQAFAHLLRSLLKFQCNISVFTGKVKDSHRLQIFLEDEKKGGKAPL